jgi:hypothetical protein
LQKQIDPQTASEQPVLESEGDGEREVREQTREFQRRDDDKKSGDVAACWLLECWSTCLDFIYYYSIAENAGLFDCSPDNP